jgi:biopolymer transport protein ExbD
MKKHRKDINIYSIVALIVVILCLVVILIITITKKDKEKVDTQNPTETFE